MLHLTAYLPISAFIYRASYRYSTLRYLIARVTGAAVRCTAPRGLLLFQRGKISYATFVYSRIVCDGYSEHPAHRMPRPEIGAFIVRCAMEIGKLPYGTACYIRLDAHRLRLLRRLILLRPAADRYRDPSTVRFTSRGYVLE